METITGLFQQLLELAQAGFSGVNQVLGILIALVATLALHNWRDLTRMAAGAAVIHVIINAVLPLLNGEEFALPNVVSLEFWLALLALFLGYLIMIALFFFVKSLFTRQGRSAH